MSEPEKDQSTLSETFTEAETTRKLFVGGLSWQTTEDGLSRYLGGLGIEVERALIMRDKLTGRSRGFGFVILKHVDMLDKAVAASLQLDGRKIEAKRAIPKRDMEKLSKKLFVGGIPISLSPSDFKKFFEQFGTVAEAQVMTERESGRSRGFGFVTFHDDEAVEKVLTKQHSIQGKPVEVKRAEPKKVERPRPIILPVPYFSAPGYPYPMAYASPAMYGQALTYDPSGYFLAQPMYAPQFIQMEDPGSSGANYEYGYYDPSNALPAASSSPASSQATSSPPNAASPPSSSQSNPAAAPRTRMSRRDVVSGKRLTDSNDRPWNTSNLEVPAGSSASSSLSFVDRVRNAKNEVRKRNRGNSTPDSSSERLKRLSTPVSSGNPTNPTGSGMPTQRRSVVTMTNNTNWRSRVPSGVSSASTSTTTTTTTTTTATTTGTAKEGGALHKYFQ